MFTKSFISRVKFVFLILFLSVSEYAISQTTFNVNNVGADSSWDDSDNWKDTDLITPELGPPNANDIVIWQSGGTTRNGFHVTGSNATGAFTIDKNSATLTISGDLTVNGNLTVNNGLTLVVTGTLTITGAMIVGNGGNLDMVNSGNINVGGNFTTGNGAIINFSGDVNIGGNWNTGNSSSITVNSPSVVIVDGNINTSNEEVNGDGILRAATCTEGSGGTGIKPTGDITCADMVAWLPIVLGSFDATPANNVVTLEWETISEENFDFFSIERSEDGENFYEIGTTPGHGNSNDRIQYSFEDDNPLFGLSFYRLNAIDHDGTYEKFQILPVQFVPNDLQVSIYPNPGKGNNMRLRLGLPTEAKIKTVSVYSLSGERILEKTLEVGKNDLEFQKRLDKGLYFAKIQIDNYTTTQKLIIN